MVRHQMFKDAVTSPPQVIDGLSNQLMDPFAVLRTDEILHLLQLPLQLLDTCIPIFWPDAALQDLLHSVLNVLQVPLNLAQRVVPQLEASVTVDAVREDASEATSALIAPHSCCSFPTFTRPRSSVALGHLRALRVTVTL